MGIFLARYRARVNAHFESRARAVPLASAASESASAPLTLYLANDLTGALVEQSISYRLPTDVNTRARVVLEKLLSEYTRPESGHPLKALPLGVPAVEEVYLLPVPGAAAGDKARLAVVDLTPTFVHMHPSGIEPESLTLLSMIATLHGENSSIAQVRFLVDGQTKATLAGHAELDRVYLAGAAQMEPREAFTTQ